MTIALITLTVFVHKIKLFACHFILYAFFIATLRFYTCIRTFLVDVVQKKPLLHTSTNVTNEM